MIGNDIVDLAKAKAESKLFRSRYLAKICAPSEIEAILNSSDSFVSFWRIWTMKESAYKAFQRQLNFQPVFNPFAFVCELESSVLGKVIYKNSCVLIKTLREQNFIYSEVNDSSPTQTFFGCTADFLSRIKSEYNLNAIPEVIKNEIGVPDLNLDSGKLCFSKTHHGDFQAFQY